jgi:cardiolipin synthase
MYRPPSVDRRTRFGVRKGEKRLSRWHRRRPAAINPWVIDLLSAHWATFYFVTEWAIRLSMVAIVPFRRSPEAARSWLLLLFFLPIPGLLLYLAIGRPIFPQWRVRRFAALPRLMEPTMKALDSAVATAPVRLGAHHEPIAMLTRNLGRLPVIGGNRLQIITDYDGVVDRLVKDIDAARDHVHVLVYIFADDETGRRLIAALGRAAARGVRCRVLIDALGSRPWAVRVVAALRKLGVQAHEALPVRPLRWRPARADLRNHRKLTVIDGHIAYVGSQNWVDADFRPGVVNEELMARVEGPLAAAVQAVFLSDWYLETEELLADRPLFPSPVAVGDTALQLLPSGPDYPVAGAERMTVALIHAARRLVVITTPYFIPDEGLTEALQTAVLRGVEVVLVMSLVQDQRLVGLAQRSFYAELMGSGVRIFLYRGRLLHAKHLTVDTGIASIGSSNVDIRSFTLNAEANLIVYDAAVVEALAAVQAGYFANSIELDPDEWRRRPLYRQLGENIARLVSPLL